MAGDRVTEVPESNQATAGLSINDVVTKEEISAGRVATGLVTSGVTSYFCYGGLTALAPESFGLSLLAIPACVYVGIKAGDLVMGK